MIINDSKKVCFVHIPKCAGTSIRDLIQEFDDLNGAHTERVEMHPELGLLDYVHIPLPILSEYFPELYSKVKSYHSFALIRDPYQRFASSVAQRLRMYCKKDLKDASNVEIIKEIDDCIEFLKKNDNKVLLPAEYIHFQRQSSYIFNDEQIVHHLYLLSDVNKCLSDLTNLFELDVDNNVNKGIHSNKSLVYRSKFFLKVNQLLSPLIRLMIPSSFVSRLRRLVKFCVPRDILLKVQSLIFVSSNKRMNELFATDNVRGFIEDYYKQDIELYNSLKENMKL